MSRVRPTSCHSYLRSNAMSYNMPAQFPTVHPFIRSISSPQVSSIVDHLLSIPQSRVDNNNSVAFRSFVGQSRFPLRSLPPVPNRNIYVLDQFFRHKREDKETEKRRQDDARECRMVTSCIALLDQPTTLSTG